MSVTERLDDLLSLLKSRPRGVEVKFLKERWNCSPETARRMLARAVEERRVSYVAEDVKRGRYRLDPEARIEAPGLFFHPDELASLLGLAHWMETLGPPVLKDRIDPIRALLEERLRAHGIASDAWGERIRLLPMHFRRVNPEILIAAADATLRRRRLELDYKGFEDADYRLRRLSPQSLVRYRDNWSLDAWCHESRGLRQFVLSRARGIRVLGGEAREVPREKLDAHFAKPYGIFAGRARHKALLIFEGKAARIVAEECWHPKQRSLDLMDGRFRLEFPCGDVRELARDVMRFADEVRVESPPELREAVEGMVKRAWSRLKEA